MFSNAQQYEKDCKMQMIAVEFAKEYNKLSPPKPVEFLEAFMLQVMPPFLCRVF
jgi:hypothetical protein